MATAHNEHPPQRKLKYSVALLVLLLLAYAAFISWKSWHDEKSDALSRLAMMTDLGETAVDTYFTQLEIGLQSLGMDLTDTRKQPDFDRFYALLNRFLRLHTELNNVMLIRADGQIVLTGKTPHSKALPTLANEPSFLQFRNELQQGNAFAIGQPVIGHIDNTWVISARHGIKDQTGKLTYILSANLPINMMQNFWQDAPTPAVTALGLIRDDGYLVSHYPNPDVATLDQMYGKPVAGTMIEYLRTNNFPQRGHAEGLGSTAPVTVIQVVRRLTHYPLTLFVEMPMSEIKAAWWKKMQAPYFLIALLLAGIVTAYRLTIRRRRAWSLEQRREENRRTYEQALLERSPNEIYLFDEKTLQFTYVNDYALNNLGYTLEQVQRKTLLSLHPQLTEASFAAMIEPLHKGEQETIKFQTTQTRANGSTYPVEVHLQLISSEDDSGFLAIVNDITALNQAEDNIRQFNAPVERRTAGRTSRLAAARTSQSLP